MRAMDIIRDPRPLFEADKPTALLILQIALEEIGELLYEAAHNDDPRMRGNRIWTRRLLDAMRTLDEYSDIIRARPDPPNVGELADLVRDTRLEEERPPAEALVGEAPAAEAGSSNKRTPKTELKEESKAAVPTPTSSSSTPSPNTTTDEDPRSCAICMDDFIYYDLALLPCKHEICRPCLNELFSGSAKDESRYPSSCYTTPIPLSIISSFLPLSTIKLFQEKSKEYECKNRVYCWRRECGEFIGEDRREGRDARCAKCRGKTCVECGKGWHEDEGACRVDEEEEKTLGLLEKEGWRRCEKCGMGVERMYGCNKMRCVCGGLFCYECGAKWKSCTCPYHPLNMHMDPEVPLIPEQLLQELFQAV